MLYNIALHYCVVDRKHWNYLVARSKRLAETATMLHKSLALLRVSVVYTSTCFFCTRREAALALSIVTFM
jgi:hypothetical protein